MKKRNVVKVARVCEAKADFTTSRGGSGFNISNNPLAKGKGTGGGG